jgi:hypothetical protein
MVIHTSPSRGVERDAAALSVRVMSADSGDVAVFRAIPARFPALALGAPEIRRDENKVTASYYPAAGGLAPRLTLTIESFDTAEAAEAGRKLSEDTTPAGRTRQEVVGGILCSVWESRRLLGRIGLHVVNVSAPWQEPGDPLIRSVFESLVAALDSSRLEPRLPR